MVSLLEKSLLAWISNFSSTFLPANNISDIRDGNIISYVIHTMLENAPVQDFVPFSNNSCIDLKATFTSILERLSTYMFIHLNVVAGSKEELFDCLYSNIHIDSIAQTECSTPLVKILEVLLTIAVQSPTKEKSILGILQLPGEYQSCLIDSIQNVISIYQKKSHKVSINKAIDKNLDHKTKVDKLQADLEKLQQAYRAVCLENNQKKSENIELKKKVHELESGSVELKKYEHDSIEYGLGRESESHKQRLYKLKEANMLNELDIVVKALQKENEFLKSVVKQNESALISYSKRVDELSVYVTRYKMLEDELEIMKGKMSANKELEKSVQRLEGKIHTANEYIKQLEAVRDQYEKKIVELSAINKQEATLKANSERLRYDLSRLTQKLSEAENTAKEKDLQLVKLKEKLELVKKSESVYKALAEQSKPIHQHSNLSFQQLKTDLEKTNIKSAYQYQSTLADMLEGCRNIEPNSIDTEKLYLSLKVMTRQIEADALERMHEVNEGIDLKVTEMRKITQNVLSLIKQEKLAQKEKRKIQQELTCAIQNQESVDKENSELQQKLSCLTQERDSTKEEVIKLKEELVHAIQKQESVDKENSELQQKLSCLTQERDSTKEEVIKLKEELVHAIQKQESVDKENSELQQKLSCLTQERDSTKEEVIKLKEELVHAIQKQESVDKDNFDIQKLIRLLRDERDDARLELAYANQEKKERDEMLYQAEFRNKYVQQKVNTQSIWILVLYSMLLKSRDFKKLIEQQKNQLASKENIVFELLEEKKALSVQLADQNERFDAFLNEKAIQEQNFEKELEALKNKFDQRLWENSKDKIEALKKKIQQQKKRLEHQNIELKLAQDSLHQMGLKLYEKNSRRCLDLCEQQRQEFTPFESEVQKYTSVCVGGQELDDVKNGQNAEVNLSKNTENALHDKTKLGSLKKSAADKTFKPNRMTLAKKALMPRPSYQQVVRLSNGYPTTKREADEWDAQQAKKDEAAEDRVRKMLDLAPQLGIHNFGLQKSAKGKVHVAIRVRPLDPPLEAANDKVWVYNDTSIVHQNIETGRDAIIYTFDRVYNEEETNDVVFRESAMDIVDSVVQGINGTIFTYGQTASGKTFTMCGDDQNPGIILLVAQKLFNYVKSLPDQKFTLHIGYIEIYNEVVTDLLNPENTNLKIHENPLGDIFVGQLTEEHVTELSQITKLLKLGEQNRKVGNTNMTERSSRSHTIFKIKVKSEKLSDRPKDITKTSVLNLVDLAGSERASLTGAEGTRLKEGSHINKSLLALKRVISALAEKKGAAHIPFRDSKLTRILQPALGGNSRTAIICTITPSPLYQEESHTTLKFADCAKKIRTKPRVNESAGEIKKFFLGHIKSLESQLIVSNKVIAQYKKRSQLTQEGSSTDQVCDTQAREAELSPDLLAVKEQPKDMPECVVGDNERRIIRGVNWRSSLEKNSRLKHPPMRNSLSLDGSSVALARPEYKSANSINRMSYEGELETNKELPNGVDCIRSTEFQDHLDKLNTGPIEQEIKESEEDQKTDLVSFQFKEANENLELGKCDKSEFLAIDLKEAARELEQKTFYVENKYQEMGRLQEVLSGVRDAMAEFLSVESSVSEFKKEDVGVGEQEVSLEDLGQQEQEDGLKKGRQCLDTTTDMLGFLEQLKGWLKNENAKRFKAMQKAEHVQRDAVWETVDEVNLLEKPIQAEEAPEDADLRLEHVEDRGELGDELASAEGSEQCEIKKPCGAELRAIDIVEAERQINFQNELQQLWMNLMDRCGGSDGESNVDTSDLDVKVEVRREELNMIVKEFTDTVSGRWRETIESLKRRRALLDSAVHEDVNQNVQDLSHSSHSSNYSLEHMNLENQLEASLSNYKKLKKENECLVAQLQQASKQLEVSDKQIGSLRGESHQSEARYMNLENMNAQSQSAIQKIEEELTQSRESYRKLKLRYDAEVKESEKMARKLEAEKNIAEKQLLALKEKDGRQEETIQELNKILEELKGRVCKKSVESNEYDKRVEKQLKHIEGLEYKIKVQDELIEGLRSQVSGFVSAEEKVKNRVELLCSENLAYKNKERQWQNLEKRYSELERQFKNASIDADHIEELKCNLAASSEREKKLKRELSALQISSNEFATYKAKNEKLMKEHEVQLRQAQNDLDCLTAQHESICASYKKENAGLLEKVGKLESAVNPLELEKRQFETKYNESQKELAELKSKVSELSLKWQMALQEADESHCKYDRFEKELGKMRNDFGNLLREKGLLERQNTQLSETISRLKEEAKKSAQPELDQQQLLFRKLKDENHRMSTELDEARLELFKARNLLRNNDQKENNVNLANRANTSQAHNEDAEESCEEEGALEWTNECNRSPLRILEEYKNGSIQEPGEAITKLNKSISCYYSNKLKYYKRANRDLKKNLESFCITKERTEACWQDKCNKMTCEIRELNEQLNNLYLYAQNKRQYCSKLEEEKKCLMSKIA
ncbi:kinesin-related protein 4-like [Schistocerca gregaria]|uniref:kinesin-related protein 4-like n=1 Tax=Schistocerca gregaria TaxID=7010 RepID=UPI00211EE9F9|nr:kinesin-related protein 4-like [Schistocerca gregaria]